MEITLRKTFFGIGRTGRALLTPSLGANDACCNLLGSKKLAAVRA
jgi:hypothetical protein